MKQKLGDTIIIIKLVLGEIKKFCVDRNIESNTSAIEDISIT